MSGLWIGCHMDITIPSATDMRLIRLYSTWGMKLAGLKIMWWDKGAWSQAPSSSSLRSSIISPHHGS